MGYGEKLMKEHIHDIKEMKEWMDAKPYGGNLDYAIERVEYFRDELFKYSKFDIGDEIEIAKDMELTLETSPGYMAYFDRLQVGCCGIVVEVDHYKGVFRYSVTMDPQKKDEGYFTIREETLKLKGWDQEGN